MNQPEALHDGTITKIILRQPLQHQRQRRCAHHQGIWIPLLPEALERVTDEAGNQRHKASKTDEPILCQHLHEVIVSMRKERLFCFRRNVFLLVIVLVLPQANACDRVVFEHFIRAVPDQKSLVIGLVFGIRNALSTLHHGRVLGKPCTDGKQEQRMTAASFFRCVR